VKLCPHCYAGGVDCAACLIGVDPRERPLTDEELAALDEALEDGLEPETDSFRRLEDELAADRRPESALPCGWTPETRPGLFRDPWTALGFVGLLAALLGAYAGLAWLLGWI